MHFTVYFTPCSSTFCYWKPQLLAHQIGQKGRANNQTQFTMHINKYIYQIYNKTRLLVNNLELICHELQCKRRSRFSDLLNNINSFSVCIKIRIFDFEQLMNFPHTKFPDSVVSKAVCRNVPNFSQYIDKKLTKEQLFSSSNPAAKSLRAKKNQTGTWLSVTRNLHEHTLEHT